jgi:hypothetical protein
MAMVSRGVDSSQRLMLRWACSSNQPDVPHISRALSCQLRGLAVEGGRQAEEVQDLQLLGGEFGFEGLHEYAVAV